MGIGDVEFWDVEFGDVEIGDVEFRDLEFRDVEIGDVEYRDVEFRDASQKAGTASARGEFVFGIPKRAELMPGKALEERQSQGCSTCTPRGAAGMQIHHFSLQQAPE